MDGNADRSTGLESADAGGNADHSQRPRCSARDHIAAALEALEGCNKQEAQEAKRILVNCLALFALEEIAPGEGIGCR